MQLWHLTLAARTRHALFPEESLRLRALRKLITICSTTLVIFGIVDDHLHWVVLCDERRWGYIARSIRYAVQALSGVETKPVHVEPIHGRNHLENIRRYILRQPIKHGLPEHPALWTGSCFQDLVGARRIPGLQLRLPDVLPRCTTWHLCRDIDLPPTRFEPASNESVRTGGAKALANAAAAACGAAVELTGRTPPTVAARRTTCTIGREVGFSTSELAWALGILPGSVRRLAGVPPAAEALRTTRVRISLMRHVERSQHQRNTVPNRDVQKSPPDFRNPR